MNESFTDAARVEQQLAFSRMRLAALAIAAEGSAYEQGDFLSVPAQLDALAETVVTRPSPDGALCGAALAAMLARGLPVSHPLVREMLASASAEERYAVAEALDPADETARALLEPLYNDRVGWVREAVRKKLEPYHVRSWGGLFSKDPFEGAPDSVALAARRVIEVMSRRVRTENERAKQLDDLRPALDALDDDRLSDLCAVVVEGDGLIRPIESALLVACRDRALLGLACERAGHKWLRYWSSTARAIAPIDVVPLARRAPMQLAMLRALCEAHTAEHKQRWPDTNAIVDGEPWRHEPASWVAALRELYANAYARPLLQVVAKAIDPAFVEGTQRDEAIAAWLEGAHGSWAVFEDADGSLEALVAPMPKAKARAIAARATTSAHVPARMWGLRATLTSLWEEGDEPRGALADRYFEDPTNRALALRESRLAPAFVGPLRRALVTGELREWSVVRALGRHLLAATGVGMLIDARHEGRKKARLDPSATLPADPLTDAEQAAFARHRRDEFDRGRRGESGSKRTAALYELPSPDAWSEQDAKLVDDVARWASTVERLDEVEFVVLAEAIAARPKPEHAEIARRLMDELDFVRRLPAVLAGLQSIVASRARDDNTHTIKRDRDGWGDDD
ncbi:MAG: hypothetical protein JNK05_06400 [Myxococcales bacterium]|nr:hypothetical protein [Myxococcales bacterium]